jgi:hypothetical protein
VTVPVTAVLVPPVTFAGEISTPVGCGGTTVTFAVALLPLFDTVTVTTSSFETTEVVAVKVADLDPAAIVTLAGACTEGSDTDTVSSVPPDGAAADIAAVKVRVVELPPSTVAGVTVSVVTFWRNPKAVIAAPSRRNKIGTRIRGRILRSPQCTRAGAAVPLG